MTGPPIRPAGSNPAGPYQSECRPGGPYGALKQESLPGPVRPARWYHIDNRARG